MAPGRRDSCPPGRAVLPRDNGIGRPEGGWGNRARFYSAILGATRNLLREAAGAAGRFVYISSIAALGLGSHLKGVPETAAPRKSGVPYNDAKADTEALVREYHDSGKIDCVIVRPANVTGPGSVWVTDIIERMRDMMVPLIDGGRHSASLVYVDSLVDGIIRAGTITRPGGRPITFAMTGGSAGSVILRTWARL